MKWSLDRARDPKAGVWNSSLASIDSIEAKDPTTVALKLKHPDPTLLPALATFNSAILPKKLFEAASGATPDEKAKAFAEKPDRHRAVHAERVEARRLDEAEAQSLLLEAGRGR